jgi:type I restriction enzyme S subunit
VKKTWLTKGLGAICQIRPPKAEARNSAKEADLVSFVPMEDLGIDQKFLEPVKTKPLKEVVGSYTYFADGDVLLAKITPCFENGKLGIANNLSHGVGFGSSEYVVFRPDKALHNEWLYYFLSREKFRQEGALHMAGAVGHKRVTKEFLESYQIPMPSLTEQKRLCMLLDEILEAIDVVKNNADQNLQNARALFETYLQSIFTKRGKGWVDKTLDEVCVVDRGSSPRPIKEFFTTADNGVNWIKISDTEEGGKYVYSTAQKITPEGAKQSRYVKEGDFILTNSMSYGRPYIMKTSGYIHDGWFVLRLNISLNTDYFYYLLSSGFVQAQFLRLASGAVVKNISGDLVKKVILPIPPMSVQESIVSQLEEMSSEIERLEGLYQRKLSALEELQGSILDRVFSGGF